MSEWKPTGNKRFRVQPNGFRKGYSLVLQIEERGLETWCIAGQIDSDWANRWRDARIEDLSISVGEMQAIPVA